MVRTCVATADVSCEQHIAIRLMLVQHQRQLLNEIQIQVRDVREEGAGTGRHATDPGDTVDVEPEDDLPFALIQMKTEMLEKVTDAVRRCDQGAYGNCLDCGDVIASSRLRAMPFAVRCRECEQTREDEQHHERVQWQRVPSGLGSQY
jgi:DnaK suppressor protein